MAKKEEKQASTTPASSPKANDDVVIHVMPKVFIGKEAKEKQKPPAPKPKPKPKPPAPKPKPAATPKKSGKGRLVLLAVGILLIGGLAIGGYLVTRPTEDTDADVEVEIEDADEDGIEDDDDNCPDDANEDQDDLDGDGLGDACDDTDDTIVIEVEPEPGQDTDSDGLTDVEEDMYGTDSRNPDTDGDTFLDGNEVFHRYDPLGFSPSTLLDTGSVEIVEVVDDVGTGFLLYAPADWSTRTLANPESPSGLDLMMSTDETATMEVSYYIKDAEQSFEDWFDDEMDNGFDRSDLFGITSKEGYGGYLSNDELVAYLVFDEGVYAFSYDLRDDLTIEYLQTFEMILNSFLLLP